MRAVVLTLIAIQPFLIGSAISAQGIAGGLAALGTCVRECVAPGSYDFKPTERECLEVCECWLTIESSRWREEMTDASRERRGKLCAAQVWPQHFAEPDIAGKGKRIIICTPMLTRPDGSFPPEVRESFSNGLNDSHWQEVDRQVTLLKNEKSGNLYKAASKANDFVLLVVTTFKSPTKIAGIDVDAPCPARHTSKQYLFDEWVKSPGLMLKKVKVQR